MNRTHLNHRGLTSAFNDDELPSFIRDSGLRGMGRIGVFVVACCLLPTMVGCMRFPIRHGMIVKGDWSLEMNRIPWMKGRDNVYQEPSELEMPQNICATEIDSPFATNAVRIPSRRPMAGYCPDAGWGDAGCGCVSESGPTVGYQSQARFHPVPTRSVFGSDPSLAPTLNERAIPAPIPPVRSVPNSLEPPLPLETEVLPTPPASPEGPKDETAVYRETGTRPMSWVFSTATAGNESAPDDDQRYTAGRVSRTIR